MTAKTKSARMIEAIAKARDAREVLAEAIQACDDIRSEYEQWHDAMPENLQNSDKGEQLQPYVGHLSLIVLAFPAFTDGRSYSIARALRLNGYRGELRAEGNVLPDQLQFMKQVGFDSFVVTDRFPLQDWQVASHQMSLAYQRGLFRAAQETEVWSDRHQGFAAWEEQPHAG